MDINLKETNENEVVNKLKKIFIWPIHGITIISIIIAMIMVEENKILTVVCILLVYINIILLIKITTRTVRIVSIWKLFQDVIDGVESKKKSIDEIQKAIIDECGMSQILCEQCRKLIGSINTILQKISTSESNITKNEKMNIELVRNVTNKLDNPLDSIVENIDILKSNINDKKALGVLKEKASKLKSLIEELFEAAKLASGDINLELSEIEIVALLKQSVIEIKDKIDNSNLIFKVNLPKDKIKINADGEKIWRVFDILLENTLKHSLEYSRVYIDLVTIDTKVIINVKNTSKQELNINPIDLVKIINNRDDDSTGLGLEIVKNLVELQGGIFNLDIEADLFKVEIIFDIVDYNKEGEVIKC